MNKPTRVLTMVFVVGVAICLPRASQANVDSFFDVFFDVAYDQASDGPVVSAQGVVRMPKLDSRTVDTEILSMSLTSHASGGSTEHVVTLMYGVSGIGSSGEDGIRGYAELDVVCRGGGRRASRCSVRSVKPLSEGEFRGHVTVLK